MQRFQTPLKRGNKVTHHKMSNTHLGRYATEFAERHNMMASVAYDVEGKQLK